MLLLIDALINSLVWVLFRGRTILGGVFQVVLVTDPALQLAVGVAVRWKLQAKQKSEVGRDVWPRS